MLEKVFNHIMCQEAEDNHIQSQTLTHKDITLTDTDSTLNKSLDTNSMATVSDIGFENKVADSDNHNECGNIHFSLLY